MISFRQHGKLIILDVSGSIEGEALSCSIEEHLNNNIKTLVVNLSELQVVESRTLGILVASLKLCEDRGGELVFFGVNPYLDQMLTLTKLKQLLKIYNTEDDALTALEAAC